MNIPNARTWLSAALILLAIYAVAPGESELITPERKRRPWTRVADWFRERRSGGFWGHDEDDPEEYLSELHGDDPAAPRPLSEADTRAVLLPPRYGPPPDHGRHRAPREHRERTVPGTMKVDLPSFQPQPRQPRPGDGNPPWDIADMKEQPAGHGDTPAAEPESTKDKPLQSDPPTAAINIRAILDGDLGPYLRDLPDLGDED